MPESSVLDRQDEAATIETRRPYPNKDMYTIPPEYTDAWIADIAKMTEADRVPPLTIREVREALLYCLRFLRNVPLDPAEGREIIMSAHTYAECRHGGDDD